MKIAICAECILLYLWFSFTDYLPVFCLAKEKTSGLISIMTKHKCAVKCKQPSLHIKITWTKQEMSDY